MSMFAGNAMPSLSDIAAVTGNRNGDGFGNGEGWWVLIILFVLFGGWGNGGYGNNGGGCQGAYDTQAVVQRGFDTQAIISKLDGINNGIYSLGYDQLAQTNNLGTQIMQSGFATQQAINADTVANMQNTNALSTQLADCCCKTQTSFMNVINQMDKNACALNNNVHQTGDAIIQNQTQGFQMLNNTIKDGFSSLEMREMQRENADLRQKLNNCDRDSALQGTASYIINSVRPTPIPAWTVQNPWANYNSGANNGCGCCNQNGCCA